MEVNDLVVEKLKGMCKKEDVTKYAMLGETIDKAFEPLSEDGKKGKMVYFEWNGKTYYSFQTVDEMYKTFSGKTKEQFLEEKKKEEAYQKTRQEREKAEASEMKENFMKTEYLEIKKKAKKYFNTEKYNEFMEGIENFFNKENSLYFVKDKIKDIKKAMSLLEILSIGSVKNGFNTKIAESVYAQCGGDYDDRLKSGLVSILQDSIYFEEVLPFFNEDIKEWYDGEPEKAEKAIKKYKEIAEKNKQETAKEMGE